MATMSKAAFSALKPTRPAFALARYGAQGGRGHQPDGRNCESVHSSRTAACNVSREH
jgi:hypothetical protein